HLAGADHGADGGAGDDVGTDARPVQRPQHADVRPAARRAAPEGQPDLYVASGGICRCHDRLHVPALPRREDMKERTSVESVAMPSIGIPSTLTWRLADSD